VPYADTMLASTCPGLSLSSKSHV